MLQFTWKIILCNTVPCLDFVCINARTLTKKKKMNPTFVALFAFLFSKTLPIQRKRGKAQRTSRGGGGGQVSGERDDPEGIRVSSTWGWDPKGRRTMIWCAASYLGFCPNYSWSWMEQEKDILPGALPLGLWDWCPKLLSHLALPLEFLLWVCLRARWVTWKSLE